MRKRIAALVLIAMVSLTTACGHKALNAVGGHADASTDAGGAVGPDSGAGGAAATSTIVGACTADTDCVAVLDYRAGFECWSPSAASTADVARDACLVPWTLSHFSCPSVMPPLDCPGGLIAVQHSCPMYCRFAVCSAGRCTVQADFSTPSRCNQVDAGAPPDCDVLRATYFAALTAAQLCDPAKTPTRCFNAFYDTCGCPAAADLSNPWASALQCAQDALQEARCDFGSCPAPCPSETSNGAYQPTCVPDPTGTRGTCGTYWRPSP